MDTRHIRIELTTHRIAADQAVEVDAPSAVLEIDFELYELAANKPAFILKELAPYVEALCEAIDGSN